MSVFRFKKFSVQNEKSAMKVNTDSVLLGAWAPINSNAKTGLDIGSGTGILTLMLVQRNPNLTITGIEIENGEISLIKWQIATSDDGTLKIVRVLLEGPKKLIDYKTE